MQEDHDVAVGDDVVLPFGAHLALLARGGIRAEVQEFLPIDNFGADKFI